MDITNDYLQIPIHIEESQWENGEPVFVLVYNEETDNLIGKWPIVVQGDSIEEVKKKAFITMKIHLDYLERRSRQLDLWKPFQRGSWKGIATHWFTIFGINVYFRHGKGMKGGFYIPFTKLNISVHNYWRRKKITK